MLKQIKTSKKIRKLWKKYKYFDVYKIFKKTRNVLFDTELKKNTIQSEHSEFLYCECFPKKNFTLDEIEKIKEKNEKDMLGDENYDWISKQKNK